MCQIHMTDILLLFTFAGGIRSETVVVPGSTSAAITRTSSTASRTTTSTASGVVVTAGSTSGIRNVNLDTEVSYSGIWTTVNQGCGNTAPHRILNTGSSDVWSATINFDREYPGTPIQLGLLKHHPLNRSCYWLHRSHVSDCRCYL